MDPWRDFPSFTDGALDAFLKRFPSHPDHAAALAEFERRRKERDQRVEARNDRAESFPVGKGSLAWVRNVAIGGITILALAVLSLALPIFTSGTQRARRPTAVATSFPKPSATKTPTPRSSPEVTP
jgi:hypothetical protein